MSYFNVSYETLIPWLLCSIAFMHLSFSSPGLRPPGSRHFTQVPSSNPGGILSHLHTDCPSTGDFTYSFFSLFLTILRRSLVPTMHKDVFRMPECDMLSLPDAGLCQRKKCTCWSFQASSYSWLLFSGNVTL